MKKNEFIQLFVEPTVDEKKAPLRCLSCRRYVLITESRCGFVLVLVSNYIYIDIIDYDKKYQLYLHPKYQKHPSI